MIFCFFNFFLRNTYSQLAEHLSSAEQSSRKAAVDSLVFTHAVGSTISTTTTKKLYFLLWRPPTTFRLSKISPRTTATNGPGLLLWITNRDNAHRSVFQPSVDPCGPPKNNDANIVINLSEFRHVSYRYLYRPCNTRVVFRTEHNRMFKIRCKVIAMPKALRKEDIVREF